MKADSFLCKWLSNIVLVGSCYLLFDGTPDVHEVNSVEGWGHSGETQMLIYFFKIKFNYPSSLQSLKAVSTRLVVAVITHGDESCIQRGKHCVA